MICVLQQKAKKLVISTQNYRNLQGLETTGAWKAGVQKKKNWKLECGLNIFKREGRLPISPLHPCFINRKPGVDFGEVLSTASGFGDSKHSWDWRVSYELLCWKQRDYGKIFPLQRDLFSTWLPKGLQPGPHTWGWRLVNCLLQKNRPTQK